MPPAFVIQHHRTGPSGHYDLMLDAGAALATWRLERLPQGLRPGQALPAQALGDHRRAYLTYEGPVSGDRGSVRIADCGLYRLIRRNKSTWFFTLAGRRGHGRFRLRRLNGDAWELTALPEEEQPPRTPRPHRKRRESRVANPEKKRQPAFGNRQPD